MDLWFSSVFLVVGLFLSSSAQTPEECKPLVTPLSMADPSVIYGRMNLIMGYVDNGIFNDILKATESSWVNMSMSTSSPNDLVMAQLYKMNGTCIRSNLTLNIEGDTAKSQSNFTFQLMPNCDGCMVTTVNSTFMNINNSLQKMNFSSPTDKPEINARALYLFARGMTLEESDLEVFKKQASCLGFTREPDFHYNPENEFCKEDEGVMIIA
uniref:Apolipoprotein M n=1 Tax=Labrus bergylta TaxID=56723 RepID=A0A3Q3H269_9LABR